MKEICSVDAEELQRTLCCSVFDLLSNNKNVSISILDAAVERDLLHIVRVYVLEVMIIY